MEDNRLNFYLDEIGHEAPLGADEERRLWERKDNGDERAMGRLVESYLRLVVSVAAKMQGRGLSIDDLVSEGNIGLLKAVTKYDRGRGVPFAPFAVPLIRQQMERALKAEEQQTSVESGRSASSMRSVDAPISSNSNVSLLSVLADSNSALADSRVYSAANEEAAERSLACLQGREAQVVAAYFGIGQEHLTMAEIADDMGLKRERVRQIRDRAVRRMRKVYRDLTKG
ncbi:MAG: sigma-70 family RNA polymerase sigma factor [Prevotella sp.]|nr:sigma-70 family RNA polymerase sigma factor [Prevotella sp.]